MGIAAKEWYFIYSFVMMGILSSVTFMVPSNGSDFRMVKAQMLTWGPFFFVYLMTLINETEDTRTFLKIATYIAMIGSYTFDWGAFGSLCFNELITNEAKYWGKVLLYFLVNVSNMILTWIGGPLVIFWIENSEIREDLCVGAECPDYSEANYEGEIPEDEVEENEEDEF